MDRALEIKIGLGLSSLVFGATMKDAEKAFGIAEDTESVDELNETPTTVWYYTENGFTLFFDDQIHELFNCVDIENPASELWGEKVFDMSEDEIIILFKKKGLLEYESELHEWGERRLSFDEVNIDFYFVEEKLKSINYGKLIHDTEVLILPN